MKRRHTIEAQNQKLRLTLHAFSWKGIAIEQRLPWLGRWSRICSPWIAENEISYLQEDIVRQRLKPLPTRRRGHRITTARRLPGPAVGRLSEGDPTPEAPFGLFRDWQRTQTQSSVKALRGRRQQIDVRFCKSRNHRREAHVASWEF